MDDVFTKIFKDNLWGDSESVSGPGATLLQTAVLRQKLPALIKKIKAKSLLDAPCGDFNWMKSLALEINEYLGVDIVQDLIVKNQTNYGGPLRKFLKLDITQQDLPQADLILCRDCLTHFSFEDAFSAIHHFKKSNSKFILTTTFTQRHDNQQITTGDWRPLNLQLPPFHFPEPLEFINESCTEGSGFYSDKCLGLWRLKDILPG
jgi:2-polyprenyl-3-methyl-5-hydroxy-6-metoxy-1,4-benzoquinol methylase